MRQSSHPHPAIVFFYLFNPFDQTVLNQFLNGLVASHDLDPRTFLIAYYNPVWLSALEQNPRFHRVRLPVSAQMKFSPLTPHRLAIFRHV